MPFSDNESEDEEEARAGADEDWATTSAGRKVVAPPRVKLEKLAFLIQADLVGPQ